MQIITSDFVPIQPIMVDSVVLAIGQRYDVIITANQTGGNFWMRAEAAKACASANNGVGLATFNYDDTPVADPSTTATAIDNGCNPPGALVPYVFNQVGNATNFLEQVQDLDINLYVPGVNSYSVRYRSPADEKC